MSSLNEIGWTDKKKDVDGCNEKETLEIALTNLEDEVCWHNKSNPGLNDGPATATFCTAS